MSAGKDSQEKDQKVLEKLIAAVDEDPYDARRYYDLGSLLVQLQNYSQAEELFYKALDVFKNQPQQQEILHYGLGNVFYSAGLYEKAIGEFVQVNEQDLKKDALLMIAQGYYAQGKYQQAMVFSLTASEQDPTDTSSRALLADCFLASGDFEQAKKYYEEVLKINGDNLHANFQCGLIAEVQGKDGTPFFSKVQQLDSQYFEKHQERLNDIAVLLKDKTNHKAKE